MGLCSSYVDAVRGVKRVTLDLVRELLRRHRIFFLAFTAAAVALRLLFYWKLRFVEGDSFIYGELARNLVQHHTFGYSNGYGGADPTLVRLPGYPLFMAFIWLFTGVEHYDAIMIVQVVLDLVSCFVIAALALEVVSEKAAKWTFALVALCPFFANYATTPLTETLAILFAALTFYCAARAGRAADSYAWWAGCGAAVGASILLRPDGGILLAALGGYFAVRLLRSPDKRRVFFAGTLVAVVAFAPLVPWTIRNYRVMHVFQPLAPRYANDPGEFVPFGFYHWARTWLVDDVSIADIYWPVPGDEVDPTLLPPRACDSADQCARTRALFDQYNQTHQLTPQIDAGFEQLTQERIRSHPFAYWVGLPLARVADMWLRPRTEMLPLDYHWWRYQEEGRDAYIATALGVLNLFYVVCAVMGVLTRRVRLAALMLGWVLVRTAFLATIEVPESRYVLECFPIVFVFAAAWLARGPRRLTPSA